MPELSEGEIMRKDNRPLIISNKPAGANFKRVKNIYYDSTADDGAGGTGVYIYETEA